MPDAAEQATRRPRRSRALEVAEHQRDEARADNADLRRGLEAAATRHDQDVAALLRVTARAAHSERLLGRAVTALGQWRDADGRLDPTAADVLVDTVSDVLGLDPDYRPPRIRSRDELDPPWTADHADDDEPPVEP